MPSHEPVGTVVQVANDVDTSGWTTSARRYGCFGTATPGASRRSEEIVVPAQRLPVQGHVDPRMPAPMRLRTGQRCGICAAVWTWRSGRDPSWCVASAAEQRSS